MTDKIKEIRESLSETLSLIVEKFNSELNEEIPSDDEEAIEQKAYWLATVADELIDMGASIYLQLGAPGSLAVYKMAQTVEELQGNGSNCDGECECCGCEIEEEDPDCDCEDCTKAKKHTIN